MIAHNIRYSDLSITNTLKILDRYTRDDEYETLYLFLFGCDFDKGDTKQTLRTQIDLEEKFKKRLETEQTKSAYETSLSILLNDIEELETRKNLINISPTFENDLDELNEVKYEINKTAATVGNLELKKNLINESKIQLANGITSINNDQIRQIYTQATSLIDNIQKTFEDLVSFHNTMITSKILFITNDLPNIEREIENGKKQIADLLEKEKQLNSRIKQSDSFEDLESIIVQLNEHYQKKGEYENIISQISKVDSSLSQLTTELSEIDDVLFSDEYKHKIQEQLNKLNKHFSNISNELYGEKYAIKLDEKSVKGRRVYEFTAFNTNFSSGKKQGEISCFDFAYTLFADEENIPCMHFLLNDKKELMHDNQLIKLGKFANDNNIQLVAAMLKDKLPTDLNKDEYIIIRLSQSDKLFKIENK
jgi:uncharacterized protein YydD (DUF2326 family)